MLDRINKVNNFLSSKTMVILDYLGAFAILGWSGYEYYTGDSYEWILGFGVLALIFAIIKPAKYINGSKDLEPSKEDKANK